jgi:ABC-type glycerol-3-phosphate transport system substrate-binding protein
MTPLPHLTLQRAATVAFLAGVFLSGCGAPTATPGAEVDLTPEIATPAPTVASPPPPAAPASPLAGAIRLWVDWAPEEMSNLLALVEAFEQLHPEVAFSVAYYSPDDLLPAIEAANSADSPTLFLGPSAWGPALWRAGRIRDVGERVLPEMRERIDQAAWSQVDVDGAIIGLPIERQGQVLYRNRALVPQEAGTVTAWIDLARQRADQGIAGARLDLGFDATAGFLAACGDLRLMPSGVLTMDEATGICWLTLIQALRESGIATYGDDSDRDAFVRRQTPWLLDRSDLLADLSGEIGEADLAIDAWPVFDVTGRRLASHIWTQNAYFSSRATPADTEAAWAFVAFLLTPDAQAKLSLAGQKRHLPIVRGLQLSDARLAELALALDDGIGLPLSDHMPDLAAILERAGRSVAEQGVAPDVAWRRAQENLRTLPAGP